MDFEQVFFGFIFCMYREVRFRFQVDPQHKVKHKQGTSLQNCNKLKVKYYIGYRVTSRNIISVLSL